MITLKSPKLSPKQCELLIEGQPTDTVNMMLAKQTLTFRIL